MLETTKEQLRPALVLMLAMTILLGIIYPLLVTGIAQMTFPWQANGSLLTSTEGQLTGSALVGQSFTDPAFFWGRLSATAPYPYNAAGSSGSNYGPLNSDLHNAVQTRVEALRAADPENNAPIPVDLVTASGSGLDPHISPAAALYQVPRVARMRGLDEGIVRQLVDTHTRGRFLGILGEPVVNVLELNIALDMLTTQGSYYDSAPA